MIPGPIMFILGALGLGRLQVGQLRDGPLWREIWVSQANPPFPSSLSLEPQHHPSRRPWHLARERRFCSSRRGECAEVSFRSCFGRDPSRMDSLDIRHIQALFGRLLQLVKLYKLHEQPTTLHHRFASQNWLALAPHHHGHHWVPHHHGHHWVCYTSVARPRTQWRLREIPLVDSTNHVNAACDFDDAERSISQAQRPHPLRLGPGRRPGTIPEVNISFLKCT